MRPRKTSVSLLSLLSRGSDETKKTWVSLLSLGTGVSAQTKQTRRSLQKDGEWWRFICPLCVEWVYERKMKDVVQSVQVVPSVPLNLELLVHPETQWRRKT